MILGFESWGGQSFYIFGNSKIGKDMTEFSDFSDKSLNYDKDKLSFPPIIRRDAYARGFLMSLTVDSRPGNPAE